jgi:hypothetical protein
MKYLLLGIFLFLMGHHSPFYTGRSNDSLIAVGQMPDLTADENKNIHIVYGNGDSLFCAYYKYGSEKWSSPVLIKVLPGLVASHTRGPQIANTDLGLVVTACDEKGDIYSFQKQAAGDWMMRGRVNDKDTVAKENLMALAGNGSNAFAVWLDLRDRHNKIYGSRSSDGGKSWSRNIEIYASPDNTVCECCKPSVSMDGNKIYVMFRNWLNGNRDMYLAESGDGGLTFNRATQLGQSHWPLNACPMDGGGLSINKDGTVQAVWRREQTVYSCMPNAPEIRIATGRDCAIEAVGSDFAYAWIKSGDVVCKLPGLSSIHVGKGSSVKLKSINRDHIMCVWENEGHIVYRILNI